MPRVQISISLPFLLKLNKGLYPVGQPSRELQIDRSGPAITTIVSVTNSQPNTIDTDEQRELNARQADQLLNNVNRLLRSYRAVTRIATIIELSRVQASPFRFRVVSEVSGDLGWEHELVYTGETSIIPAQRTQTITKRVRTLLASGNEPDVADLFLLDAELAIHEGRFREAVLFCWSTIDATFNRKYDQLVDAKLTGEWSGARSFFKGVDFGLKNKMSTALYLISGRSLFRESGDLWPKLSRSYYKRNGIIHRGESAVEDDARQALDVARRIVDLMSAI